MRLSFELLPYLTSNSSLNLVLLAICARVYKEECVFLSHIETIIRFMREIGHAVFGDYISRLLQSRRGCENDVLNSVLSGYAAELNEWILSKPKQVIENVVERTEDFGEQIDAQDVLLNENVLLNKRAVSEKSNKDKRRKKKKREKLQDIDDIFAALI